MKAVGVGCTHHGLIQSSNLEPLGHLSIGLTRRRSNKFLESKINKDHLNFWSHILGWVDQNRYAPELVFGAWCCRDLPCGLAIWHCPSIAAPPTLPNFNHRDKKLINHQPISGPLIPTTLRNPVTHIPVSPSPKTQVCLSLRPPSKATHLTEPDSQQPHGRDLHIISHVDIKRGTGKGGNMKCHRASTAPFAPTTPQTQTADTQPPARQGDRVPSRGRAAADRPRAHADGVQAARDAAGAADARGDGDVAGRHGGV